MGVAEGSVVGQFAACQKRRPAYRHSRNTATLSAETTDRVTVNQSPPFPFPGTPPSSPLFPEANAQHDSPRYHRQRGTVVPCRASAVLPGGYLGYPGTAGVSASRSWTAVGAGPGCP